MLLVAQQLLEFTSLTAQFKLQEKQAQAGSPALHEAHGSSWHSSSWGLLLLQPDRRSEPSQDWLCPQGAAFPAGSALHWLF